MYEGTWRRLAQRLRSCGHFCMPKMAVSRHLGFYRTANSAIRSADPESPSLGPNMEWIGCTVCEIFAFKLHCDLETWVRGHSRSSKVAPLDRAHMTLYSSSILTACIYYRFRDIAAYWSKIATPLVSGTPIGGEAPRFPQGPLVTKN